MLIPVEKLRLKSDESALKISKSPPSYVLYFFLFGPSLIIAEVILPPLLDMVIFIFSFSRK